MHGVPTSIVKLISCFHQGMFSRVHVDGGHTEQFAVTNGLHQGCTMAPVLFRLYFFLVLEKWCNEMAKSCPDGSVFISM